MSAARLTAHLRRLRQRDLGPTDGEGQFIDALEERGPWSFGADLSTAEV